MTKLIEFRDEAGHFVAVVREVHKPHGKVQPDMEAVLAAKPQWRKAHEAGRLEVCKYPWAVIAAYEVIMRPAAGGQPKRLYGRYLP